MSDYTIPTDGYKPSPNGKNTSPSELSPEQVRNLQRLLRRMSQGKRLAGAMPDIGPQLAKVLPDVLDVFEEDGIQGFQNACDAISIDYPIVSHMLKASPYKLLSISELLALPEQSWLLDGILYEDAISVIYGLPGCNKSFISLDWACCMALGWEWKSHPTKMCRVIYVAAEGARGYRRRVQAWAKHHNVDPIILLNTLLFLPREIDLFHPGSVNEFINELVLTVEDIKEETKDDLPTVIVIDTVFQCAAGQNLNASEVMSQLTSAIKIIKRETNAIHVLAVHHSGKDVSKGMTGSIALKANVDCSYYVESDKDGLTKVISDKVKDDDGIELYLQRIQVTYGDGPRDNSCVMLPADRPQSTEKVNDVKRNILAVLPTDKTLNATDWLKAVNDFYPSNKVNKDGDPMPYVCRATFLKYKDELLEIEVVENMGTAERPAFRKCVPE